MILTCFKFHIVRNDIEESLEWAAVYPHVVIVAHSIHLLIQATVDDQF